MTDYGSWSFTMSTRTGNGKLAYVGCLGLNEPVRRGLTDSGAIAGRSILYYSRSLPGVGRCKSSLTPQGAPGSAARR